MLAPPARAQEALRSSLAGQSAAEARARQLEARPYNFHAGDFKLFLQPQCAAEYNDNVNLSHDAPQQDEIFRPELDLAGSYPLSTYNGLSFELGVGYDAYVHHTEYSGLRLHTGSEVAFDFGYKDLWVNTHDRFQYVQDPAQEAAAADTAKYGSLQNTAGLSTDWDLRDVILTLGYDHHNFFASSSDFEYLNSASEYVLGRAGARVHPRVVTGLEGTGGFTRYDQAVLNDNQAYSGGAYADWAAGTVLHIQPRFGYTVYDFDQTSQVIPAVNQNTWYCDLTIAHQVGPAFSYRLSAGHELRLGIESDSIEDWYVRPNFTWGLFKYLNLNLALFYEHGTESADNLRNNQTETYNWTGGDVGLSYPLFKRFTLSLDYRLTLRFSNVEFREYTQNLVALRLYYDFK